MLTAIRRLFRTPPLVTTARDYDEFLQRQAAFVSQKCIYEYCRARAGLNWDKLFKETDFVEAMSRCRWEAFVAVYADITIIAEGYLRTYVQGREVTLAEALSGLFAARLGHTPVPSDRAGGWRPVIEELGHRLARVQLAAPKPVHKVGEIAGDRVFDVLPIHADVRRNDRELVRNNVRFALCRMYEDMERGTEPAAVAADLVGPAGEDGWPARDPDARVRLAPAAISRRP